MNNYVIKKIGGKYDQIRRIYPKYGEGYSEKQKEKFAVKSIEYSIVL